MKRMILGMFLMGMLMCAQVMNAQVAEQNAPRKRMTKEQMTELRINRMMNDLELDDAAAAKFKVTYQKYMEEMAALRATCPMMKGKKPGDEKVHRRTDAEVDKAIQDRFDMSRKKLDLREKYYKEFRKFLSPRQIEKIYFKEKNYGKAMRKEFGRRKAMKERQSKVEK